MFTCLLVSLVLIFRRQLSYFVVVQNPLCKGLVQHFPVPLLQSLWLWDLLVGRMAVEDVVVSFTWRTRPDVALGIPEGDGADV